MKKLIIFFSVLFLFTSCQKKGPQPITKWEYKEIIMEGTPRGDFFSKQFYNPTDNHNNIGQSFEDLGKEGWELVDVYTEIETVYPDFGGEKTIIHYKENTRTSAIHYIFKRPYRYTE